VVLSSRHKLHSAFLNFFEGGEGCGGGMLQNLIGIENHECE